VRTALHLAAVLGNDFDLLDAALIYEQMFRVRDSDRWESAMGLRSLFDTAVNEGILEQSFACGDVTTDDADGHAVSFEAPISEEEETMSASLGNVNILLRGRKSHPLYAENRRYRFTHDSWKISILNIMLDGRKAELHEHAAITLEREMSEEAHDQDDLKGQLRVFTHWNSSGNFAKAAELGLKIGSQMMILGLNPQAIMIFDDVLDNLTSIETEDGGERYGGESSCVFLLSPLCEATSNIVIICLFIFRHRLLDSGRTRCARARILDKVEHTKRKGIFFVGTRQRRFQCLSECT
jgi:hypothetical protein